MVTLLLRLCKAGITDKLPNQNKKAFWEMLQNIYETKRKFIKYLTENVPKYMKSLLVQVAYFLKSLVAYVYGCG